MLPNLVSLAIFVRAVESRSLSKAASKLNIALGAASRRISDLEAVYGVQLLYRSNQGVDPTPAGEILAKHARGLLELGAGLPLYLEPYTTGVKGLIRIGANTSSLTQFLADDLGQFTKEFPDVRVRLEELRSSEIVARLREDRTDIGVVMEGVELEGLTSYEYRSDKLVAVVPKRHALRSSKTTFSKLLVHDFVSLDSNTAIVRLLTAAAAALGEPLRLRAQVQSFEVMCRLVQAGMGITVLPEIAAKPFVRSMDLRTVSIDEPWVTRRSFICVREPSKLSAVGRKLLDICLSTKSLPVSATGASSLKNITATNSS